MSTRARGLLGVGGQLVVVVKWPSKGWASPKEQLFGAPDPVSDQFAVGRDEVAQLNQFAASFHGAVDTDQHGGRHASTVADYVKRLSSTALARIRVPP